MKKKFRLSLFMSKKIHKALTAGVLACVVSCGAVLPVEAATQIWRSYGTGTGRQTDFEFAGVTPNWGGTNYGSSNAISNNGTILYKVAFGSPQETGAHMAGDGINDGSYTSAIDNFTIAYDIKTGTAKYYYSEYQYDDDDEGTFTWELTATEVQRALGSTPLSSVLNAVKGGSSYDAGNGITISSDNKVSVKASNGIDVGSNGVSVKAGTNVTVNANGVSVTGNGSVADGNTGLINGDKLYDEVRSSANGNYVKTNNTTAANLKALDDKIGAASVANGTYIKTGNTVNANLKALDSQIGELNEDGGYIQKNNNVSQNLAALDNAIDNVVNSGLQFGANSGDDVTNKIGSKVSIIGGGTKADSEYDSKNIKTIIVQDENGNTQIEIDLDKNPEFASILTEGDANIGGKLNVGGDTHLKSNLQIDGDTNISGNTTIEKDLTVKGDSNLEGNAHVYQNLQVDGNTNMDGNTYIGNDNDGATLTVGKEREDNGKFVLNGDGSVSNTFTVGNGDKADNLTVNGTTNLNGDATIGSKNAPADLTVYGNSKVSGNGHYGGNLTVDGDANVGGTLTANRVVTNDIQLPEGSLTGRLDDMDTRISKVGAGAAALAGLHYAEFEPGSKFSMALGTGNYKSKTAMAFGGQYHFDRNTSMNLAATVGNGENMISAGLTFRFGTPRSKYQKDNDALRAENDMLNKRLKAVEKKIQSLSLITEKRAAFPDVEKTHWANKAVETLHGNGFIKGYEDGNFKGNRQMTRYEYAEMLYNALSQGAKVDQAQLDEYAPELHRVNADRIRSGEKRAEKKVTPKISTTTVKEDADTQAFGQAYNANHAR